MPPSEQPPEFAANGVQQLASSQPADQVARSAAEQGIAEGAVVVVDPLELDAELDFSGAAILKELAAGGAALLYHELAAHHAIPLDQGEGLAAVAHAIEHIEGDRATGELWIEHPT